MRECTRAWLKAWNRKGTKQERLPAQPQWMVFHGLLIFGVNPIKFCLLTSYHLGVFATKTNSFWKSVRIKLPWIENRWWFIVISETQRKKLSCWGRPAKQPLCNDFCRVCSVNFKTYMYYEEFNPSWVSMKNLLEEPRRAGVKKCCLVDLL